MSVEKSTVLSIFGKHDIVMKSIHVNLGNFQNRKTGVDGFVLVYFGSKSMNFVQDEIERVLCRNRESIPQPSWIRGN